MKDRLICKTRVIKEGNLFFVEYQEQQTFFEKIFFVSQPWHPLLEPPKSETIKMDGEWVNMRLRAKDQSFRTKSDADVVAQLLIGKTEWAYRSPDRRTVVSTFDEDRRVTDPFQET